MCIMQWLRNCDYWLLTWDVTKSSQGGCRRGGQNSASASFRGNAVPNLRPIAVLCTQLAVRRHVAIQPLPKVVVKFLCLSVQLLGLCPKTGLPNITQTVIRFGELRKVALSQRSEGWRSQAAWNVMRTPLDVALHRYWKETMWTR